MPTKQNGVVPKQEPDTEENDLVSGPTQTTSSVKRKNNSTNNKATTTKSASKKRKKTTNNDDDQNVHNDSSNNTNNTNTTTGRSKSTSNSNAGHRPVTSCTHCRQHKIKCNASEKFPDPCSRCQRMNLKCEIDPQFRPKKGSQIQSLRNDVDELRSKIAFLTKNENLIAQVLQKTNIEGAEILAKNHGDNTDGNGENKNSISNNSGRGKENKMITPPLVAKTHLKKDPVLLSLDGKSNSIPLINDSAVNKEQLNVALKAAVRSVSESPATFTPSENINDASFNGKSVTTHVNTHAIPQNNISPNTHISEFVLGDVKISIEKAKTLHKNFVDNFLPYLPILISNDPIELYQQSQLLFWTVMLTSCLSDPVPSLYMSFASLIKQLAIETCWIRTPRSTHIVQSLLILSTWPLPNQKVLDDCSYRFIGLAKSLSLQLGLHRGKFMSEFSRTQVALPDAEKWRSRTWLAVFFCEQFWSSNLGLPPSLQTDFILESARIDQSLPKNFRCLISLAIFQAKLVNIMGLNVSSPDGLMEPANRAAPLHIMERELERLAFKLQIDDLVVECYYLYVKLMVCLFSFLPETTSEDQAKYVTIAYNSATRIITIMSKLLEKRQLTEYPIYLRHSVTTAAFILFRLHLTPYLLPKYIDSARQSIVTVHRLFRNMLGAWKDVENDISRTATVLEKLNFVIITHPELYVDTQGIIVRMRSHLTGSLFYDLVWNIHEARRRSIEGSKDLNLSKRKCKSKSVNKPLPLPFYNQITKDDFTAITTTTPNGTTITKLVPTDQAIINAKESAFKAGLSKPTEINGIPLAMLEATGSISSKPSKVSLNRNDNISPRGKKNILKSSSSTNVSEQASLQVTKPTSSANLGKSKSRQYPPPPLFPNVSNEKISLTADALGMRKTSNSTAEADFKNGYQTSNLSSIPNVLEKGSQKMGSVDISNLDSLFDSPKLTNDPEGEPLNNRGGVRSSTETPEDIDPMNEMFIDSIFQQNSKPIEDDDLLGWFDMNMAPEF